MDNDTPQQAPPLSAAEPRRRRIRWWRVVVQILLALITAGLVYAIILPAIMAPKGKAQPDIINRR